MKAALLAFFLCLGVGCSPSRIGGADAASAESSASHLLECLEAVDFNARSEVERGLRVSFSGGAETERHLLWSAQRQLGPSSSMVLYFNEGKAGSGGRSSLLIILEGASLSRNAALRRYPNPRFIGLPPSHSIDGEWTYQVDFDDRILGLGFDQSDPQFLRSIALRPQKPGVSAPKVSKSGGECA